LNKQYSTFSIYEYRAQIERNVDVLLSYYHLTGSSN
jgi:hypothetical protein